MDEVLIKHNFLQNLLFSLLNTKAFNQKVFLVFLLVSWMIIMKIKAEKWKKKYSGNPPMKQHIILLKIKMFLSDELSYMVAKTVRILMQSIIHIIIISFFLCHFDEKLVIWLFSWLRMLHLWRPASWSKHRLHRDNVSILRHAFGSYLLINRFQFGQFCRW